MAGPPDYWAFLSYSHRDRVVANWLHHAIETYHVPPRLVGTEGPTGAIPERLAPIFRDREELAASADLGDRLRDALAASRYLIVLCSPAAAASRWTNEEILQFKRHHPASRVLAAIVAGEPFAREPAEECFPPALRFEVEDDGTLSTRPAEPIAADLRPQGDGRRHGKLKLIAGMLGVGLDELVQRDQARRQRRLVWLSAASLAGMGVTSGLALYANDARHQAEFQREQADGMVEFMLTDLRQRLEPVGRLDALDEVGRKALSYYAQQDADRLGPDALGRRARAMHLVGEVADLRGKPEMALASFREAAEATGALYQHDPDDWQRVYDHAQSVFWLADMERQNGHDEAALRGLERYRDLTRRLVELKPDDRPSQLEAAYGEVNLGPAYRLSGRTADALAALERGRKRLLAITPRDREVALTLHQAHAHASSILEDAGEDERAVAERRRAIAVLGEPPLKASDREVAETLGIAYDNLSRPLMALGRFGEAGAHIARAQAIYDRLTALDPSNTSWAMSRASIGVHAAMLDLLEGRRQAALARAAALEPTFAAAARAQPDKVEPAVKRLNVQLIALLAGDRGRAGAIARDARRVAALGTSRSSETNRATVALALVAAGDALANSDRAAAASAWRDAAAMLDAGPRSTLASVTRERALRRLGQPVPAGAAFGTAYGGRLAR